MIKDGIRAWSNAKANKSKARHCIFTANAYKKPKQSRDKTKLY
jgi:hypothetical protein